MTHATRLLVLSLVLIASISQSSAQDYLPKKDSLLQVISTSKGEAKLDAYYELSILLIYYDPQIDTIVHYLRLGEAEARRQNHAKYTAQFMTNVLPAYFNHSRYDDLIREAAPALDYLREKKNWKLYFDVYTTLLEAYYMNKQPRTSLEHAEQLYTEAKALNHTSGMAGSQFMIGMIYAEWHRYEEAEKACRECIKAESVLENPGSLRLYAYMSMFNIYAEQKKWDELLAIGREYEAAVQQYERQNIPTPSLWSELYKYYANMYVSLGQFDEAENYCRKALEVNNTKRTAISINYYQAQVEESRGNNQKALDLLDGAYEESERTEKASNMARDILQVKARVLLAMGRTTEVYPLFETVLHQRDSVSRSELQAQLDEIQTLQEVDRHIAEKERQHLYFLFALGACCLLAVALGIWIYYNRKVTRKNRILATQIGELTEQQERQIQEVLARTTFVQNVLPEPGEPESDCPENRKDKLCMQIRELILKDKLYLDPALTRDDIVARLGTNKNLFIDAFQECFGMSFNEYIANLRLKEVLSLLAKTDLSIEDISQQAGFGTTRTLRRQFNDKYGMSPADYRRLQK